MKNFLSFFMIIAMIVTLVLGNIYWNNKTIHANVDKAAQPSEKTSPDTKELLAYTANWPDESQKLYKEKLRKNEPFSILIAGSPAINGLANQLIKSMEDTYGDTVQISTHAYDLTSTEFVNQEKQKELIEAQADLIVFEPLTLKDNGQVAIDDSHAHINTIIQDVTDANEQTTFVIQPPHPLYNATYYPLQVEALKQYTTDNDILYLDHWNSWPDQTSEEMKALLTEDNELPNKDGYKIWHTYLEDFFIARP